MSDDLCSLRIILALLLSFILLRLMFARCHMYEATIDNGYSSGNDKQHDHIYDKVFARDTIASRYKESRPFDKSRLVKGNWHFHGGSGQISHKISHHDSIPQGLFSPRSLKCEVDNDAAAAGIWEEKLVTKEEQLEKTASFYHITTM